MIQSKSESKITKVITVSGDERVMVLDLPAQKDLLLDVGKPILGNEIRRLCLHKKRFWIQESESVGFGLPRSTTELLQSVYG